jgi:NAD(P)-dependent dehydrogenase (short-subunit alcohol dehydrogenase family)
MTVVAGSVAVVTGGASGIGLGITRALADAGARVVIADVDDAAAAEAAERIGGTPVQVDVSDEASVRRLHATVTDGLGPIGIWINNAGVGPEAPIAEMTTADWSWMLGINLWGVIYGVSVALPGMLAVGRGSIVNVSSMSALAPMPPLGGYAVSKAGVSALTEVLAREVEGTGVHAALVVPGPVHTNIGASLRHRADAATAGLREFRNAPPAHLWREPAHVGALVVQAIEEERSLVVTHPELVDRVISRHRSIEEAFVAASDKRSIVS